MSKTRKIISLLLAGLLLLSAVACDGDNNETTTDEDASVETTLEETSSDVDTSDDDVTDATTDPNATTADNTTAPNTPTTDAPSTGTSTPAEIATLYNNAMNKTKAYAGRVKINKNEGTITSINAISPDISMIRDAAEGMLPNDYPKAGTETFNNGNGEENPDRKLAKYIPPGDGSQSALTAEGIKSAKCTPQGGGYIVEITLVEEVGNDINWKPPHHASCMDTLSMTADDIKPFTLKSATITYKGAIIKAVINADGLLTSFELDESANIKGKLALSLINLIDADLAGSWKQDMTFEYLS